VQVAIFPTTPGVPLSGRDVHDGAGMTRHVLAVETGLNQPPLATMELAFAREQPLSEEIARLLERAALREVAMLDHEHVVNEIGMVDEEETLATGADFDHVAVFTRQARQKVEPVAPKLPKRAAGKPA
jgi:hypothetical protein